MFYSIYPYKNGYIDSEAYLGVKIFITLTTTRIEASRKLMINVTFWLN